MVHKAHRPHNFTALSKPKPLRKHEHKAYWPFIPLVVLVAGTILINLARPLQRSGVLAYATNVSSGGLLNATNAQRQQNGAETLEINSSLSTAAQAKANDMITRNYWAHVTPDGQQPWVFVDGAGYKYQKAGENLAYGFVTSNDTVTGWMNSQTHRDNLLDKAFTEVGFGYANGENFNGNGQETVVVAMYGKPQVLANANAVPEPPAQPVAVAKPTQSQPVTTDNPITTEPAIKSVARIQSLTGGNAPWTLFASGLMTGLIAMFLLAKHAAGLRHLIRDSERFVLHHPLLDTILVSLVLIGSFLSQTTGFIR